MRRVILSRVEFRTSTRRFHRADVSDFDSGGKGDRASRNRNFRDCSQQLRTLHREIRSRSRHTVEIRVVAARYTRFPRFTHRPSAERTIAVVARPTRAFRLFAPTREKTRLPFPRIFRGEKRARVAVSSRCKPAPSNSRVSARPMRAGDRRPRYSRQKQERGREGVNYRIASERTRDVTMRAA